VSTSPQVKAELEDIEQQIQVLKAKQALILSVDKTNKVELQSDRNKNIVVIGGAGQLGGLFVNLFKLDGYDVDIVEKNDWGRVQTDLTLSKADLVLVAVPIDLTSQVIDKCNVLSVNCILADITSTKQSTLERMLNVHQGPVVGLHPMFGPGCTDFVNQTMIVCHGRNEDSYLWLLDQLTKWQTRLHFSSAKKHDETMAIVQVLRHFSTIAYGAHLATEDVCLKEVMAMSSPIYRLELAMVGRLFAQAPELYTEIIFSNLENIEMMQRYISQFDKLLVLLKKNDKEAFKQTFLDIRNWFGEHAERFLKDSNKMLNLNQNN
jgi:chorismate mutase / prephenate dehydrogenase